MPQTLFSLLAIMLLGLFSLQANRSMFGNEQKMILNEVATQATGVGIELLEEIGSYPYDPATLGVVLEDSEKGLLAETFCNGTCACDPDSPFYNGCLVINDFDGKTATRVRDDLTYSVDIDVVYVSESDPSVTSSLPTFSKRVDLKITSPLLYMGSPDNPLTFRMSRVYTHPTVTG
ncbi:MAG: hypothetical protein ACOCTG_04240 [Bacteroidota bacterium]